MDTNTRKRAPPLAAIYALRRSCTMPICRITGKSHSMDDHHYVPCLDDFPKFDRLSGCRITEKNLYFKDYKFAYPIIDLDGTARMVTEHDFHCRITSKYRAMAGHKYIYPVLGATTDRTRNDLVSVVEEESMRDVLIPREIEMIVKGGVEDVLKMKEGEYLFIHSGEGTIIPAAMKEILGKRGVRQGRRHTLPAGLEGGAASDLEEFRRSLKIKMLSEVKNPPPELAGPSPVTDVFDKIQEEVEILKDIRKFRPKRPGKQGHKVDEINKKRIKTDDGLEAEKKNIIHESKAEDVPPPKLNRLEKYKMQFTAFESNNESGNRLTLVGAFDEKDVVELDFGEPMSVEVTHIQPGKISTAVISDFRDSSNLPSETGSLSETLKNMHTSSSDQCKIERVSKSVVENCELLVSDKSDVLSVCQLRSVESGKKNNASVGDSMPISVSSETSLIQRNQMNKKDHMLKDDGKNILNKKEKTEMVLFEQKKYSQTNENLVSEHVNGKLNSVSQKDLKRKKELDRGKFKHNIVPTNSSEMYLNGFQHEMMEIDELEEIGLPSAKKMVLAEKKILDDENVHNESMSSKQSQELISPKKISHIPQSNFPKNLMSELKSKLKKKVVATEADSTILSDPKDSSATLFMDNKFGSEKMKESNFKAISGMKHNDPVETERNLSTDSLPLIDTVFEMKNSDRLDIRKTSLDDTNISPNLNETFPAMKKIDSLEVKNILLRDDENFLIQNEMSPVVKQTDTPSVPNTLLNNSPIHSETTSAMKQIVPLDLKILYDSNMPLTNNEAISIRKQTNSFDAEMISLNDSERKISQSENVFPMKQAESLDRQTSFINDEENSHIQTEFTQSRLQILEDLGCPKDNKVLPCLLQGRERKFETSENGKNKFVERPYTKKAKLEDETKLNQIVSEKKQTLIEDLSFSDIFHSSRVDPQEISIIEESSVNGNHCVELNGTLTHDISKKNCDTGRYESMAKETEDSRNRFLDSCFENRICDKETQLIGETEMNVSFGTKDIKTQMPLVGDNSKISVSLGTGNDRKPFGTLEDNLKDGNCVEQISSFTYLTGERSEFELSQSKKEMVIMSHQISSSSSPEENDLGKLDNSPDLTSVVTEILPNEKNKNLEMSYSEMKFDTQTETLMPLCSPNPFPTADNETTVVKLPRMQIQLPVAGKFASQEPVDGNIPLENVETGSGTEGKEKQCQGIDVYVAIMDFKPMGSDEEAVAMKEGQRVDVIDASKPRRWLVRTIPMSEGECPQEGWVPACYLEKSTALDTLSSYLVTEAEMDPKELEALLNREAIVKELVETEEDFAKDMQFVVENYYKQMDNPRLQKEFRDRKGSVFGNFKDISDFHNNVLMKGVNYHAKEPTKLGKTFLRLERDFDMHANYCWNEARAQRLLQEGALRDFFDDHSKMIDDDKLLTDHLKLPIQRLNDYQLLLVGKK